MEGIAIPGPGKHPAHGTRLLVLIVLLAMAHAGFGAPRIIDRVDVEVGTDSNDVHLYFNIPVRVISQVLSSTQRELNIQVQPTITPGTAQDLLGQDEVLSWSPSAEIPLDKIRFRPRGIATSVLELSFAAPVEASVVQKQRDFFSLTIRLKKTTPVQRVVVPEPSIDEPDGERPTVPPVDQPAVAEPVPSTEVADGLLVVNLLSQTRPINFSKVPPVPLAEGLRLYTTEAEVKGRTWYRLRLGFYSDRASADKALKRLRRFYPQAWIDRATPEEKAQLTDSAPPDTLVKPGVPVAPAKPPIRLPQATDDAPTADRLSRMMETARDMMTAGDYPKAIRMLTAILDQPENRYTQEARELLGLARERNGQLTHAYAEYENYLRRYPEGEDAERVRQRLAGLATAREQPQQPLRKPRAEREESPWDVFGSLSVAYRNDGIESDFSDENVTRSQIDTDLYWSARRSVADGDLRMQLTGGYTSDLLEDWSGEVSSLSDAYTEFDHRPTDVYARVGRQRLRSSGILTRFDGVVTGHRFSRDVQARVALGIPVEKSSDTFIRKDKRFAGLTIELDSILENVDVSLFFVEQDVEGLVDRRAVGGEFRYFADTLSLFGLLDYDLFFGELNTALVQTNWTFSPQTALYLILDYRMAPTLTASNALQGQTVTDFDDLKDIFSDDEIYELARDRTARSKIASLGGTQTFTNDLQLSLDFTLSNIGSTPSSGGVDATESTGNEFFYTVQLSKPNLVKQGDIGILSLRYADTSSSDTVTLSANSRYPINGLARINPKVAISYRDNKDGGGSRTTLGAQIQADYRLKRDLLLEGEVGANWYDEDNIDETLNYVDYFLRFGLRWEF